MSSAVCPSCHRPQDAHTSHERRACLVVLLADAPTSVEHQATMTALRARPRVEPRRVAVAGQSHPVRPAPPRSTSTRRSALDRRTDLWRAWPIAMQLGLGPTQLARLFERGWAVDHRVYRGNGEPHYFDAAGIIVAHLYALEHTGGAGGSSSGVCARLDRLAAVVRDHPDAPFVVVHADGSHHLATTEADAVEHTRVSSGVSTIISCADILARFTA